MCITMYGLLLSTANLTGIYVRDYVYNQLEFFGQSKLSFRERGFHRGI